VLAIFIHVLLEISFCFYRWKDFENRLTFGEVIYRSRITSFMEHSVETCHFFDYNYAAFFGRFIPFVQFRTRMNTQQRVIIYSLNGLMTSYLCYCDVARHENLLCTGWSRKTSPQTFSSFSVKSASVLINKIAMLNFQCT